MTLTNSMENDALISLRELMLALHDLCTRKQTGTMSIVTNDNHAVQFVLHEGNIVACRAGLKEGLEAVQWVKTIDSGRYFFNKFFYDISNSDPMTIGTDALLKELVGKGIEVDASQVLVAAQLDEMKAVVEEELTGTIGPIASIICEDCFDAMKTCSSSDIVKLLKDITMELEEKKRDPFRKQLVAKLKKFDIHKALSEYGAMPL